VQRQQQPLGGKNDATFWFECKGEEQAIDEAKAEGRPETKSSRKKPF
jgi:hypothetical protein